mmetsp:Transcript_1723/g.4000  ORF Transcript_1723/g.4000 Transcript_1723/m.4000 type:complete len:1048 (-) Transcript_1723:211-3354(-)
MVNYSVRTGNPFESLLAPAGKRKKRNKKKKKRKAEPEPAKPDDLEREENEEEAEDGDLAREGEASPDSKEDKLNLANGGGDAKVAREAKTTSQSASANFTVALGRNLQPAKMVEQLDPLQEEEFGLTREQRKNIKRKEKARDRTPPRRGRKGSATAKKKTVQAQDSDAVLISKLRSFGSYSEFQIREAHRSVKGRGETPSVQSVLEEIQQKEKERLLNQLHGEDGDGDSSGDGDGEGEEAATGGSMPDATGKQLDEVDDEDLEQEEREQQKEGFDEDEDAEEEAGNGDDDEAVTDEKHRNTTKETTETMNGERDTAESGVATPGKPQRPTDISSWAPECGPEFLDSIWQSIESPENKDRTQSHMKFLESPTMELIVAKLLSAPMQGEGVESIWNAVLQLLRLSMKGTPDDHYRILNMLKELCKATRSAKKHTQNDIAPLIQSVIRSEKQLKLLELHVNALRDEKKAADDKQKAPTENPAQTASDPVSILRVKTEMSKALAQSRSNYFNRMSKLMGSVSAQLHERVLGDGARALQLKMAHLRRGLQQQDMQKRAISEEKNREDQMKRGKVQLAEHKLRQVQREKLRLMTEKQKLELQIRQIEEKLQLVERKEKKAELELKGMKRTTGGDSSVVGEKYEKIMTDSLFLKRDLEAVRQADGVLASMRSMRVLPRNGAWKMDSERAMFVRCGTEYLHSQRIYLIDTMEFMDFIQMRLTFCKAKLEEMRNTQQKFSDFGIIEGHSQGVESQLRTMFDQDSKELARLRLTAFQIVKDISASIDPIPPALAPAFKQFVDALKAKVGDTLDVRKLEALYSQFLMQQRLAQAQRKQQQQQQQQLRPQQGHPQRLPQRLNGVTPINHFKQIGTNGVTYEQLGAVSSNAPPGFGLAGFGMNANTHPAQQKGARGPSIKIKGDNFSTNANDTKTGGMIQPDVRAKVVRKQQNPPAKKGSIAPNNGNSKRRGPLRKGKAGLQSMRGRGRGRGRRTRGRNRASAEGKTVDTPPKVLDTKPTKPPPASQPNVARRAAPPARNPWGTVPKVAAKPISFEDDGK